MTSPAASPEPFASMLWAVVGHATPPITTKRIGGYGRRCRLFIGTCRIGAADSLSSSSLERVTNRTLTVEDGLYCRESIPPPTKRSHTLAPAPWAAWAESRHPR